jgi:hypothetical protein
MLTTVSRFTEPWEAHLFRMLLEAEGLFAIVAFNQHASSNYSIAWAIGGVRVLVVEEELEQALAIEKRCRLGEYGAAVDAEFGSTGVPIRMQDNSGWHQADVIFSYIVSLLFVAVFGAVVPIRARIKLRA